MSDIFISYAKEDREQAGVLAAALEKLGWSVWWDRIIPTGRVFEGQPPSREVPHSVIIDVGRPASSQGGAGADRPSKECRLL